MKKIPTVDDTDELDLLVTILNSYWETANTFDKKPIIRPIWQVPGRIDFSKGFDYILLYTVTERREPMGLGFQAEKVSTRVSVDIRNKLRVIQGSVPKTKQEPGRKLLKAYKEEVLRILANQDGSSGSSGFPTPWQWINRLSWNDLSNRKINLFHGVQDIELIHYAQAVTKS